MIIYINKLQLGINIENWILVVQYTVLAFKTIHNTNSAIILRTRSARGLLEV